MFHLNKKEPVSVLPSTFNMYTEEERIIRQWIYARNKPSYSREEFCTLLRKMLLNMFSSNVTQIRRENMIEAFSAYCQKFPAVTKDTSKILKSVISLHKVGLWANSFFPWRNLFNKSVTIKNKEVQDYFATEPEEIVLARVHTFLLNKREEEALIIAKNSLLYNLRVRKDGTLSSNNTLNTRYRKSLASADWYLLILRRKKSLSSIVKEVNELNCHEGLVLMYRLRKNPECKRFACVMLQIFLARDLIHPSSYCCTMKYFDLWCLIHKELRSNHSEISNSARKLLSPYAPTSAHFYLFVDVLWKHFGSKFISLYVEFYIRGITADSNHLEVARSSNDVGSLNVIECHLAAIFTKLSTLFSDSHEEASRECMFSAFSLRPKKQKLLILQSLTHSILDSESQQLTISSSFMSPPTLSQGFYHPLLNKGVKCVSYFLMRDLVSSLEGVRRIDFQYNVFDWRNNAAELGKYVDSSEINSMSNEDSDTEYASDECIKSTNNCQPVPEIKDLVNSSAVYSTVKRKNDYNKNQIHPVGVGANLDAGYNDSNKKIKVENASLSHSSGPKIQKQIEHPYFVHNAIEEVIKRTLDDPKTRNTSAEFHDMFLSPTPSKSISHSILPFSLTETGKQQDVFKNEAIPVKGSAHMNSENLNFVKPFSDERNSFVNYSTFENAVNRESVVISPKVAKNFVGSLESHSQANAAASAIKSQFDKITKYSQGNVIADKAPNGFEALNLSSKVNYVQQTPHKPLCSNETNHNLKVNIEKPIPSLLASSSKHIENAYAAHNSFSQHVSQTSELFAHQLSQHNEYAENVNLSSFPYDGKSSKPVYSDTKTLTYETAPKSHFIEIKTEFTQQERYSVIQHTTQHTSNETSPTAPDPADYRTKVVGKSLTNFPLKIANKPILGKNVSQPFKSFPPKTAVVAKIALDSSDGGSESKNSSDFASSVIMAPRWETSRHHHGTLKYKKNPNLIGVATATKKLHNKPYPKQKALLFRNPLNSNTNVLLKAIADNPHIYSNQNTSHNTKSVDMKVVAIPQSVSKSTSSHTWNPVLHLESTNSVSSSVSEPSNYATVSSPAQSTAENLSNPLNPQEYAEHNRYRQRKYGLPLTNNYFCSSSLSTVSASLTNTSPQYKNVSKKVDYAEVSASSPSSSNFSNSSYKHSIPSASSGIMNERSSLGHAEYKSSALKNQYQYSTILCNSSVPAQSTSSIVTSQHNKVSYPGRESVPCCSPAEIEPCASCTVKNNFHLPAENVPTHQNFAKVKKDISSLTSATIEMVSENSSAEQCSVLKEPLENFQTDSDYNLLSSSASRLNFSNDDSCIKENNFKSNMALPISHVQSIDVKTNNCFKKQNFSHSNSLSENESHYSGDFNHKNSILPSSSENQIDSPNIEENMFSMCVDLLNNDYQELTPEINSVSENKNFDSVSEQNAFFSSCSEENNKMGTDKPCSSDFNNGYDVTKSCSNLTDEKPNEMFCVNTSYEDDVFQQNHYKEAKHTKELSKTDEMRYCGMSEAFINHKEKLDFNSNTLNTKVSQSISSLKKPGNSTSEMPAPIICRICKLRLRSAAAMKRHLKKSHPSILQESMREAQFAISSGDKSATTKKEERVLKSATSQCKYCGKILTNLYMRKHILTQHANPQIKSENLSDPVNNIKNSNFLDQNVDSNTCLSASDALNKKRSPCGRENQLPHYGHENQLLKSKLSSPVDVSSSSIYKHRSSSPELKYNLQDSYFHSEQKKDPILKQALKRKKTFLRSTNCQVCLKTFSSYGNLTRHLKTKHPEIAANFGTNRFDRSANVLESNILPSSSCTGNDFSNRNSEFSNNFPQSSEFKNSETELKVVRTSTPVNFSESRPPVDSSLLKQSLGSDWLFPNNDQDEYNQLCFNEKIFPNNSTADSLLNSSYDEHLSHQYPNPPPPMVSLINYGTTCKSSLKDSFYEHSQVHAIEKPDNEELKYLVIEDNTYITDFNSDKTATEENTRADNFNHDYQNSQIERKYIAEKASLENNTKIPEEMKTTLESSFRKPDYNKPSFSVAKNDSHINEPVVTNSVNKIVDDTNDLVFDQKFFDVHCQSSSNFAEVPTTSKNDTDDNFDNFNYYSGKCRDENVMATNFLETFSLKTENIAGVFDSYPQKIKNECIERENGDSCYIHSSKEIDEESFKMCSDTDVSESFVNLPSNHSNEKNSDQAKFLSTSLGTTSSAEENNDFKIHFGCSIEQSFGKTEKIQTDSIGDSNCSVEEKCDLQSVSKTAALNSSPELNHDVSNNDYLALNSSPELNRDVSDNDSFALNSSLESNKGVSDNDNPALNSSPESNKVVSDNFASNAPPELNKDVSDNEYSVLNSSPELNQDVSDNDYLALNSSPELSKNVHDNDYDSFLSSYDTSSKDPVALEMCDSDHKDSSEDTAHHVGDSIKNMLESHKKKVNSEKCKLCQKSFSSMPELSKHLKLVHCIPLLEKQPAFEISKILIEDNVEKLSPPNLLSPCYDSESELPLLETVDIVSKKSMDISSQSNSMEEKMCCDNMKSDSSFSSAYEASSVNKELSAAHREIDLEKRFSDNTCLKSELTDSATCHDLPKKVVEVCSHHDDAQEESHLSAHAECKTLFSGMSNSLFKDDVENLNENKLLCKTASQEVTGPKKTYCENVAPECLSIEMDVLSKDGSEISCHKITNAQDCFDSISSTCMQTCEPEVRSLLHESHESAENQTDTVPQSVCEGDLTQCVPEIVDWGGNSNPRTRRHSFSDTKPPKSLLDDGDKVAHKTLEYLDLDTQNRGRVTIYEISRSNQNIDPNSKIVHPLVLRKKKYIRTLDISEHSSVFQPQTSHESSAVSESNSDVNDSANSTSCTSVSKGKQFRRKRHKTCFSTKKHKRVLSKLNSSFSKRNLFLKKIRRKRYEKLFISSRNTIPCLKVTFNKEEIVQFLKCHQQPVVQLTRLKLENESSHAAMNSWDLKQDLISAKSSKVPIVLLEKIDIFGSEITSFSENSETSSDVLPIKAEINILGENDILNVNCHDLFGSSEDDSLHVEDGFLPSENDVNVSNVKISVLLKNIKIGLEANEFNKNQNTGSNALERDCSNAGSRDRKESNYAEPPPGKKCCVLLQRLPS